MSEYLGAHWVTSPISQSHQITKKEESHLETSWEVYMQTPAAKRREAKIQNCGFNNAYKLPQLEIELHKILRDDFLSVGSEEKLSEDFNECDGQENLEDIDWGPNQYMEIENWLKDVCAGNDVDSDVFPDNQVDKDDEGLGLEDNDWNEIYKEFEKEEKDDNEERI